MNDDDVQPRRAHRARLELTLDKAVVGKTAVVIAHRLSTMAHHDRLRWAAQREHHTPWWSTRAESPSAMGSPDFERRVLRYQGFAGAVTYPELTEELGYLAPLELEHVRNTNSGHFDG